MDVPKKAMVLAAGFGSRLGDITKYIPKPLVKVGDEPILLRTLYLLKLSGVKEVVINTHYYSQQIIDTVNNVKTGLKITFLYEEELLGTGGGIKNALDILGTEPFLVVNGDIFWDEENSPLFTKLSASFDGDKMDALLAIVPEEVTRTFRTRGGDFILNTDGTLCWATDKQNSSYVYSCLQIINPSLVAEEKADKFSLTKCWKKARDVNRLYGYVYQGDWVDMGTPAGLDFAQNLVEKKLQLKIAS